MREEHAIARPVLGAHASTTSWRLQSPSEILPLEIWEHIIDVVAEFWDSSDFLSQPRRTTLRSCALTCREWFARCRFHLFYTSDLIQNADHLSAYVHMLRSHPDLTSLVRRLRISGSFDDAKAHWVNTLPISLSPLLTNLNHIIFTAQVSNRLAPFHPLFYQALSTFKSVTELHYTCHARQPFDNFARFMRSLQNLGRLHVDGEFLWESQPSDDLPVRPFSSTKRLQLVHLYTSPYLLQRNMVNVLNFIRQYTDTSSMSRLEVWDVRWRGDEMEARRAVGDLLIAIPNLRRALLHITLLGVKTPTLEHTINFHGNLQLRNLELQINYLPNSFKLFCDILSSISSPRLQFLTLRFNADPKDVDGVTADASHGRIDEILAHPRFASLQMFSTDLSEIYWPKLFKRLLLRCDMHFERVERMESERLHELRHHVR